MTYVLDSDVPRPTTSPTHPRTPTSIAMLEMQVGQSFAITTQEEWDKVRGRLSAMRPKRYSMRKQAGGGWRVWRVA